MCVCVCVCSSETRTLCSCSCSCGTDATLSACVHAVNTHAVPASTCFTSLFQDCKCCSGQLDKVIEVQVVCDGQPNVASVEQYNGCDCEVCIEESDTEE